MDVIRPTLTPNSVNIFIEKKVIEITVFVWAINTRVKYRKV